MGNLCGKESSGPDPFSQPGRTLSSAPPPQSRTSTIPANVKPKAAGAGRTLGGDSGGAPAGAQTTAAQEDARRKAAEAAEARANTANKSKGKLGSQLEQQKKQTRNDTLIATSEAERLRRDADQNTEARTYN